MLNNSIHIWVIFRATGRYRPAVVLFMALVLGITLQWKSAAGQTSTADQPLRIEIPARSSNETYRIIPAADSGLVLFYKSLENAGDSAVKWYFVLYDTILQQQWVKAVPLFNRLEYRFHASDGDTIVILFTAVGKNKGIENQYAILRCLPGQGLFLLNEGVLTPNDEVTGFRVARGRAWIAIDEKGRAGKIRQVHMQTGRERTFALGQGGALQVRLIKPDTTSLFTEAIVSRQVSKKSTEYYFVRYDTAGSISNEVLIGTHQGEKQLNHFQIAATNGGRDRLLLGTYGQGTGSKTSKRNIPDNESTGFFSAQIVNNKIKNLRFINFLELNNASSLVGEADFAQIREKAGKKNKTVSDFSLDYSVLLHDIIDREDERLLIAEVYAPQFRTESFTDFDYYGRPYTNTYSVFEGYRYFNAIVAGFDSTGTLKWDNNIEIRNLLTTELNTKVSLVTGQGDELTLCYGTDGKVGTKILNKNQVVENLDFSPIDLLYPSDKLMSESKIRLHPWYDQYFVISGYQEVKNIALGSNSKRFVFYFSKIRFER